MSRKSDIVVGARDRGGDSPQQKDDADRRACSAADAAGAIRIDGPLVLRIARVLDEHAAFAGVEAGMARGSRGEDAVHHVDAKGDVVRRFVRGGRRP